MRRRVAVFLVVTFLVSWLSWGLLVAATRAGSVHFPDPLFLIPLFLGGFGPAIGAYASVYATRDRAPVSEFHARLFRWRVPVRWWIVAFALPIALALTETLAGSLLDPGYAQGLVIKPWYLLVPLILAMVVGGGVEELGWRGVAQPAFEGQLGRTVAAIVVGVIWAIWHLPLFRIPGVGQYRTDFSAFAVGVVGGACVLAWLYRRTRSILLCVAFHATYNAIAEMGFSLPQTGSLAMLDGGFRLLVGLALITLDRTPVRTAG